MFLANSDKGLQNSLSEPIKKDHVRPMNIPAQRVIEHLEPSFIDLNGQDIKKKPMDNEEPLPS